MKAPVVSIRIRSISEFPEAEPTSTSSRGRPEFEMRKSLRGRNLWSTSPGLTPLPSHFTTTVMGQLSSLQDHAKSQSKGPSKRALTVERWPFCSALEKRGAGKKRSRSPYVPLRGLYRAPPISKLFSNCKSKRKRYAAPLIARHSAFFVRFVSGGRVLGRLKTRSRNVEHLQCSVHLRWPIKIEPQTDKSRK